MKKIILFTDRYGLGRIYYHEGPESFYFASEAKSLLKWLPELREFNVRSLGEFFSCDCPLENRTLFRGISLLPGGSRWTFSGGSEPAKKLVLLTERMGESARDGVGGVLREL